MKEITQDLFREFSFLSDLSISEDKKKLFFVEAKCDNEKNDYRKRLWVLDTETEEKKSLTAWAEKCSPCVLGNEVWFLEEIKDQKGTAFALLDQEKGTKETVFTLPLEVDSVEVYDEKNWLLAAGVNTRFPDYWKMTAGEKEEVEKILKEEADYNIYEDYPYVYNGKGVVNGDRTRLFLFNKETKELTPVSDTYTDVASHEIGQGKILYSGCRYESVIHYSSEVYEYDVETKKTKQLISGVQVNEVFYKNGLPHCLGTKGEEYGLTENPEVCLFKRGKLTELYPSDTGFYNGITTDVCYGKGKGKAKEGEERYFTTCVQDHAEIVKIGENALETVVRGNGSLPAFVRGKDCFYVIALQDQKLEELYKVKDNVFTPLTSFNEEILKDCYVAEPEEVIVEKAMPVQGWVLKPKDYDPEKKYPAILDIHGGPRGAYGTVYCHEMQYWANHGYFVFYCNPRGSDGKGNAYADLTSGWGGIDYEDILDFTRKVTDSYPAIDPRRIGVTGGSYGGYMTNWIIGHSDRFCAAASQRSISNWITEMLISDTGISIVDELKIKNPRYAHGELWDMSPLKYVNNVQTPTLFIHSDEDYRCPLPEGLQMYTALRNLGVDSRIVIFKGENHELSRSGKPAHRSRRLQEITSWMDKYCKKEGNETWNLT